MSKIVVILGFLVSFAAGLTVGWRVVAPRHPVESVVTPTDNGTKSPTTQGGGRRGGERDPRGWLTEVLKLTPEQQTQMKEIWDNTAHQGRKERDERRQALRKERDESIAQLMAQSGKKDEFDRVNAAFSQGVEALDTEWRGRYQTAVERTKQILTPDQRDKYEEVLRRHAPSPGGGPGGAGSGTRPTGTDTGGGNDRSPGRRSETRATSRPDRQDPQASRE